MAWVAIGVMVLLGALGIVLAARTKRVDAAELAAPLDHDDPRFGDEVGRAW